MINFTGGSGVYQASQQAYLTQIAAENGTYTDVFVNRIFTDLSAATYWVALRDKNNPSNKLANPFYILTCPTTTTTTSTTTQPQVWYYLYNCSTGAIETSASYINGTFYVNQRVVYGGLFFYITQVVYTNPAGTQWSISSAGAGLEFCPSTTSTTTVPPIVTSYYVATRCDNPSLQQYFQTTGSYVAGISVRYQGYCWEIQAQAGTSGVNPESSYINCASCNGAFPTTTTSTSTSTTTSTSTSTTTTTAAPTANVTNLVGNTTSQQPSQDYYEYYFNATVFINQPYPFNINFVVESTDSFFGIQYIPVTIFAGATNGFGETGPLSGPEFGPGNLYSCIYSCDQPSITLGIYAC
jgi:hypothetical protein